MNDDKKSALVMEFVKSNQVTVGYQEKLPLATILVTFLGFSEFDY